MASDDQDVGELAFGPKRSPGSSPNFEIVRALTSDDLPGLAERPPAPENPGTRITKIRQSHHELARILARGTDLAEAAFITGYNPAYISRLQGDPQFKELMVFYREARDVAFQDVLARMRSVGLNTLEEIQDRLAEEPEKWSNKELMGLAELLLPKPGGTPGGAASASAAVSVAVRFIGVEGGAVSRPSVVIDNDPGEGPAR